MDREYIERNRMRMKRFDSRMVRIRLQGRHMPHRAFLDGSKTTVFGVNDRTRRERIGIHDSCNDSGRHGYGRKPVLVTFAFSIGFSAIGIHTIQMTAVTSSVERQTLHTVATTTTTAASATTGPTTATPTSTATCLRRWDLELGNASRTAMDPNSYQLPMYHT